MKLRTVEDLPSSLLNSRYPSTFELIVRFNRATLSIKRAQRALPGLPRSVFVPLHFISIPFAEVLERGQTGVTYCCDRYYSWEIQGA